MYFPIFTRKHTESSITNNNKGSAVANGNNGSDRVSDDNDNNSDSKQIVVRSHTRNRRRASGRTNIREANKRESRSNGNRISPQLFRTIRQIMDHDQANFPADQRNNNLNRENRRQWEEFGARSQLLRRRKRRKVKTVEEVKKEKAMKHQMEWIQAVNDLSRPLPSRFL